MDRSGAGAAGRASRCGFWQTAFAQHEGSVLNWSRTLSIRASIPHFAVIDKGGEVRAVSRF